MTAAAFRADALILVCAISAGIHAALAPEHFAEEGIPAGAGFVVSAVLLAALAVVLTVRPTELALITKAVEAAGLALCLPPPRPLTAPTFQPKGSST